MLFTGLNLPTRLCHSFSGWHVNNLLAFTRTNGKPFHCFLGSDQFPVIAEDDLRTVAGLQRHLIDILDLGNAVADE